ncbi:MAG: hypothetical protein AAGF96_04830 [Bacteroidota bacterium]
MMKTNFKTISRRIIGLWVMIISIGFACCEDDNDTLVIDLNVAEDDIEELFAVLLSYDTYGLVAQFEEVSEEIESISECEATTTNIETESGGFNNYSYEYRFTEVYTLFCTPERNLSYTLDGVQEIDAYNYDAVHQITSDFTTTGLEETDFNEIYNGNYDRTGAWESNFNEDTYDFIYDSTVVDILVSKESNTIQSGSSTFTLEQTYSRDNLTYTYGGTITFLNEDEAQVTFDDGETFIVDLTNVSIQD